MKIENNGSEHISRAQLEGPNAVEGSRAAGAGQRAGGPGGKDELALSEQARLLGAARGALEVLPEIRADKVGELRQAVQAGGYQVPYDELARRLLAVV